MTAANPEILVCVSQQPNETPYQFSMTRINVFSLEEALYHVYHYWKQSVDDFLSNAFVEWVNDALSLSLIASRLREYAQMDSLSARLFAFLSVIDYFNQSELAALKREAEAWEKRFEWEKFKERADELVSGGHPESAIPLYRQALRYDINVALLNNMGIALMQLGENQKAYECLRQAMGIGQASQANNDGNSDIVTLSVNYAETAIYCHFFDEANAILQDVEAMDPTNPNIAYLNGEIAFEQGNYAKSLSLFKQAIGDASPQPHYVFRLADAYMKMRQYEKALNTLDQITVKDVSFYMKQAELLILGDNIPAAIKSIKRALVQQNTNAEIWIKLAMCHRLNYELTSANAAITKALSLDPDNERAKLENARVKKGMGRIKEYQLGLNDILAGFKRKFRAMEGG